MKRINLAPTDPKAAARSQRSLRSLPKAAQAAKPARRMRPAHLVLTVVLAIGAAQLFSSYQQRMRASGLRHEREEVRQLKAQLDMKQASMEQERSAVALASQALESRLKLLSNAKQPAVPVSQVLAELGQLLPDDIWITQLSFTGKTIKIVGVSRDTRSVANLMGRLDKSNRFRDTAFSYTQRAGTALDAQKSFTFEIVTAPVLQPDGAS